MSALVTRNCSEEFTVPPRVSNVYEKEPEKEAKNEEEDDPMTDEVTKIWPGEYSLLQRWNGGPDLYSLTDERRSED